MQKTEGDVGKKIRILRNLNDMTQAEFAKRLGITQQHVGALELGKRNPSPSLVFMISKKFKVSQKWLRTGVSA